MASITCDGHLIKVDGLVLEDPGLAELLRAHPEERWEEVVVRSISVGARGLLSMGLGIDLQEVDERVRRSVAEITDEAGRKAGELLAMAEQAFSDRFDPERRSSMVARLLEEFGTWRDEFLARVDPAHTESHMGRFLERLDCLLGPNGDLEVRLREVLDPEADGSALARMSGSMEARFQELRDLIVGERRAAAEALRGTAKGLDYEDLVEEHLRLLSHGLGGCVVERTGRLAGQMGPQATVGDFVVQLPTGQRIVVEAKNTARVPLTGKDGILAELDLAMANRGAQLAICVSRQDAFPKEVGCFGVYGDRVLVVEDGEGTMLSVAMRWAAATVRAGSMERLPALDTGLLLDRLERLRTLAQLFSTNRRALTDVGNSVEQVKASLETMRSDLLGMLEELTDEIRRAWRETTEG